MHCSFSRTARCNVLLCSCAMSCVESMSRPRQKPKPPRRTMRGLMPKCPRRCLLHFVVEFVKLLWNTMTTRSVPRGMTCLQRLIEWHVVLSLWDVSRRWVALCLCCVVLSIHVQAAYARAKAAPNNDEVGWEKESMEVPLALGSRVRPASVELHVHTTCTTSSPLNTSSDVVSLGCCFSGLLHCPVLLCGVSLPCVAL